MDEINEGPFKGKFTDFRPHRILHDGSIVIEVEGESKLILMKIGIHRISQTVEKGGQPYIDPKAKLPHYFVNHSVNISLITREDFEKMQKSSWGLG